MSRSKVFPQFPYDRKFSRREITEILDRAKVVGRAMRDGHGPNGATLALPPDIFELWMIHAALAGVTVDENLAYIRPKVQSGAMFADAVTWVLKKEDTPAALAADLKREAEAHAAYIESLPPKVRDAVADMFVKKAGRKAEILDGADDPMADPYNRRRAAPNSETRDDQPNTEGEEAL